MARAFSSTRTSSLTFPSPVVIRFLSVPAARSYKYRFTKSSRSDHQSNSFDAGNTRQRFWGSDASPTWVALFSSNNVRTSPVSALAIRNQALLWSRELEIKASCEPSAYHWTSQITLPQAM